MLKFFQHTPNYIFFLYVCIVIVIYCSIYKCKVMKKFSQKKFVSLGNLIESTFLGIYSLAFSASRSYLLIYSDVDIFSSQFCNFLLDWCLRHNCFFIFEVSDHGRIKCIVYNN